MYGLSAYESTEVIAVDATLELLRFDPKSVAKTGSERNKRILSANRNLIGRMTVALLRPQLLLSVTF